MNSLFPERIGRYQVLHRLGVGGAGAVFLASDPLLGRTVAIKILRTDEDEQRERFEREARSAASLRHQNIVTIYDVGDHDGRPFIAMEFVDGESMAEVIRRRASLPLDQRLGLIVQLCAGLGYAHRHGLIHRDIKPANLMLTADGVLKIVDFGLARITAGTSNVTRVGMLMGTPHYMSPEQVEGSTIDHLSDIFSVGLVLYELLSYQKAFPGDSVHAVLHSIGHRDPTPIAELIPSLDRELSDVVHKAVQKAKSNRYQDLFELSAALERVRTRLRALSDEATLILERRASDLSSQRPGRRNLDSIAQKRAAQVTLHVNAALDAFDAGHLEQAIEECEQVLLLDPDHPQTLTLLERAHRAVDERQVRQWLSEAERDIASGELTRAESLVAHALQLQPETPAAGELQERIRALRAERERAIERKRALAFALERARRNRAEGALDAAARSVAEALSHDSGHVEALALRDEIRKALADAAHAATIAKQTSHAARMSSQDTPSVLPESEAELATPATDVPAATQVIALPERPPAAAVTAPGTRSWPRVGAAIAILGVASVAAIFLLNLPPAASTDRIEATTTAPAGATERAPVPVSAAAAPTANAAAEVSVSVDFRPWARVHITPADSSTNVSREPLLTPFTVALPPGVYTLRAENDGLTEERLLSVRVEPGRPVTIADDMPGFDAARTVDRLLGPPR